MRLTLSLFLLMLPLCAQPPQEAPKQGGRGGGMAPKNLKILKPEDLRSGVMRQYTQALGVTCDHCHAQDRASDDKMQKEVARKMIAMVTEINAKSPDGGAKAHVTCFPCHNGKVTPLT